MNRSRLAPTVFRGLERPAHDLQTDERTGVLAARRACDVDLSYVAFAELLQHLVVAEVVLD